MIFFNKIFIGVYICIKFRGKMGKLFIIKIAEFWWDITCQFTTGVVKGFG
jgi:hypothetical protein